MTAGEIALALVLQVVLIALNAIFASAEIAVISANATKMEKLAEDGNKRAKRIEETANAHEARGEELVSALSTPNCGAILIFRAPQADCGKKSK